MHIFDLAHLEAEVKAPAGPAAFVIPDVDLLPEEARSKIKEVARLQRPLAAGLEFPARKNRTREPESAEHEYEKPGKYKIL